MFSTVLTRSSNEHVRRVLIVVLATLMLFATLTLIPGAPLGADPAHAATIAPTSGFEIDGNLAKDGAAANVGDWLDVYGAGLTPAPASDPTTGVYYHKENTDVCAPGTDDVAAKGPAVKLADGPIWRVATGAANPSKGDLKAVWVGAEKIDVGGHMNDMLYLGFELCNAPNSEFQVALAIEGPDGIPPFSPADHPTGSTDDILIVFNFTPSTGTATALVHTFDGTQWGSSTTHIPGPSWEASILPGGSVGEVAINLTTAGLLPGDQCSSITVSDQVATINGNSLKSGVNDIVAVDPLEIDTCGTLKVEKVSDPDVPGAGPFTYVVEQKDNGPVSDSSLDTTLVHDLVHPDPAASATYLEARINVGQTDTWVNVVSQPDYLIEELTPPVGWELNTISCTFTDIFAPGAPDVTRVMYENGAATGALFTIPPFEFPGITTSECTITNTTSGVIIEKIGTGNPDQLFDFIVTDDVAILEEPSLKLGGISDAIAFTPGAQVFAFEVLPTTDPAWTHESTVCAYPGDDGSPVEVFNSATDGSLIADFDTVAGKVITCTFENNQAAKIIVEKQTLPDGSTAYFPFSGDLESLSGIQDGDTIEKEVAPGNYTSTETPPNGWDLTDISCDDPGSSGDLGTKTATFNVVAGQTVKCTFTNTETPTLKLIKTVDNGNGGDAVPDDWTLTAVSQGADDTRDISTLGGSGTADDVFADTVYDLAESTIPGYAANNWNCVGGTQIGSTIELAPGESSVCTIDNVDIAPTLKLVKTVDTDDGGTAGPGDWTLTATASAPDDTSRNYSEAGDHGTFETMFSNTDYVLAESTVPGYTAGDWSCDGGSLVGSTVTLAEGETNVTCTINNDDIAPTLKLIKTVDNGNGGDAVPNDWTLTAVSQGADDTRDISTLGGSGTADDVFADTVYDLAESTIPGYAANNWNCVGGTQIGSTIELAPGESSVCTIDNVDIAPTLKLVKTVTTDDGGTAGPGNWTLTATASAPDDTSRNYSEAGDHGTFETMFSNTDYVLAESTVPGYTAGDWSCDGGSLVGSTVTLAEGETNVTCTIDNDDVAPTLKLIKTVDNGDGGDAVPDDWTLTAVSQGADDTRDISTLGGSGTADDVFADTVYDLAESTIPGYAANNWNCVGGTQIGSTIELAPGESSVCTIDNVDIAPTLKLVKTVDTDDGGTAGPGDWTLTATASAPDDTSRNYSEAGDHGTFETVFSNTDYVLAESVVPGYTPSTWSCDSDVTVTGDTITLDEGQTGVTCTIVNDDVAPTLKLVKTVTTDDGGNAVADDWTLTAVSQGADDTRDISTLGGSGTADDVFAAVEYALAETTVPGYTNGITWSCTAGTMNAANNGVTLTVGQDAVCTIVNDDVAPTLQLFKRVVNDHGGTAVPADWTLTATSTSGDGDFSLPADHVIGPLFGSTGKQDVFANNVYTLSETGTSGHTDDYTQDGQWSCVVTDVTGVHGPAVLGDTIELTEGESAACVVVNDDDVAELTLEKVVTNDNGGTSVAADWTLKATSTSGFGDISALADKNTSADDLTGDTGVHEVHANNVYTLSETGTTDYSQVGMWSCVITDVTGSPGSPVLSNTITLAHGEKATCTATNDDDAPSLILVKDVVNNNGGDAVASAWDLFIDQGAAGEKSVPGSVAGLEVTDQAGTYDLSESTLPGYTNTLITCDNLPDGVPPGAPVTTVTIKLGETVTCTFTNDDIAPSLLLQKTVVNDNGGNGVAADWTLSAGSNDVTGSATPVEATNQAGTYPLTETTVEGYENTSITCDNDPGVEVTEVTLSLGETITCEFVNDDLTVGIDIEKSTNGHDADDPTGPFVAVGGAVTWEYVVTNPGSVVLSNVVVTDSVTGVAPVYVSGDTNGDGLLDPDETWIYAATGVAVAGQYANIGEVTAIVGAPLVGSGATVTAHSIVPAGIGDEITSEDPSHYFGSDPAIGVVKTGAFGIGDDKIAKPGDVITYTFEVSNDGNVPLTDVDVTDLTLGGINVSCPKTGLAVDESMTCSADYPVTQADLDAGTVHNCALAAGLDPIDDEVTDEDCIDTDLPLAQFGDTVWQDKNKNGVQDPGEPGINGAKVFLMDDTGTIIATATTVKGPWDGWYKFTDLMPGKYTVTLDTKSVTGALTTAGSFTVTLAGGDNYIDADFGIAEVLPVTGMNAESLALIALALLAIGTVAVLATRKRRQDN